MTEEVRLRIKEFLVAKLNPSFIIVFGSVINGTNRPDSDIDIAFYHKDKTMDSYEIFMLAQQLADILKKDVDLVDLRSASTVFQARIYSTGEVIYCVDETLRMQLQMTAYSMYARLNEDRAIVLDKIKESGSVYEQ
ncbi:nucleotidyltransferase domain-containing protein [Fictibacillus iocasae]|uniref:Nucleotidyltransferase domain-containing protein n=1 Tax=Fictibacillus iocasae TaxID=2715437 RepID=A0ABW2NSN2_9BACL